MQVPRDAYAPAIALDGWNYIRYLGPFTRPPAEPVFLCVKQEKLVVAAGREPSKLWAIERLRDPEDNVNQHACWLKREGTQTYISHRISPSGEKGEVDLGPPERFDVLRITRMKKPSHIRVYIVPPASEECCGQESNDAQNEIADPDDGGNAAETSTEAVTKPGPPAEVEWYLGISSDLEVVVKSFPPMSACSEEIAAKRPVWEFTSREEAIQQDCPSFAAPTPAPSRANDPMSVEYYTRPDRFKKHKRDSWPSQRRQSRG